MVVTIEYTPLLHSSLRDLHVDEGAFRLALLVVIANFIGIVSAGESTIISLFVTHKDAAAKGPEKITGIDGS